MAAARHTLGDLLLQRTEIATPSWLGSSFRFRRTANIDYLGSTCKPASLPMKSFKPNVAGTNRQPTAADAMGRQIFVGRTTRMRHTPRPPIRMRGSITKGPARSQALLHGARPDGEPERGLVALHRGYDGLEGRQGFWVDKETDTASAAWFAADEAFALEGEHHLMDGGRSDGEEALDVGFGGRPSEGERIGMNKGQVLTLLVGEFLNRGVHAT